MKKGILLIVSLVVILLISGGIFFIFFKSDSSKSEDVTNVEWLETELVDVRTGEKFKISDFEGKPIFVESFAVWCPICTKQQEKVKELHNEIGDRFVSISLDTDPNEDMEKILEHIERNNFDWYYAVAPVEMTQVLIEEFGNSIINAPSTPMILICEDLSFRKLGGFTVRSPDKLKEEISKGC